MPSRDWLEQEVTISRDELGMIIAKEIANVMDAAKAANFGDKMTYMLHELLVDYSASVATQIFSKVEDDEEEE